MKVHAFHVCTGGDLSVKQLWSDQSATAAIRSYTAAESYVDLSLTQGTTVALLAATSTHPESRSDWAHATTQALQAVIDSP